MVDVHTREQRSRNMSQIKAKNTKPEIVLRKFLSSRGVRGYRIHYRLPGKPDIVFTKQKIAVFIDGCFWHMCQKCFVKPATRKNFWLKKIKGNVKRDKEINKILKNEGWNVLRFWEHLLRKEPDLAYKLIIKTLKKKN